MPKDADAKTRMARKHRSKKGRELRRFLLRGLEKVKGEWHMIAATHNLLKLFRYRRSQQQALAAATGWGQRPWPIEPRLSELHID